MRYSVARLLAVATLLITCLRCSPVLNPGEMYIDKLLTKQEVLSLLTQNEWNGTKALDPYKGSYVSSPRGIYQFSSSGNYKEINPNTSTSMDSGKWRFIAATTQSIGTNQIEDRYKRLIQGKLVILSSSFPQNDSINIDTLSIGYDLVFVTNQELYTQIDGIHGSLSSYFRVNSK